VAANSNGGNPHTFANDGKAVRVGVEELHDLEEVDQRIGESVKEKALAWWPERGKHMSGRKRLSGIPVR
jgi:hypothetical protein